MEKEKTGSARTVAQHHRRAIASATLIAALAATGSSAVLADKGGRERHLGVPDVNLGLSKFHRFGAGAGPLVPSPKLHVAPGLMRQPLGSIGVPGASAPGASGLTLLHGAMPPGHLATPGLRVGSGHSAGALPTEQDSDPLGDGLALGPHNESGKRKAQAFSQESVAATDRIAATTDGSNQESSQSRETTPRQLPTCR